MEEGTMDAEKDGSKLMFEVREDDTEGIGPGSSLNGPFTRKGC